MNDSDDSGKSENDNFDGLASLHYLFGKYEVPPWTFRLEGTYVRAPMSGPQSQGQFAYRLTDRSGSSSGAFDVWWDAVPTGMPTTKRPPIAAQCEPSTICFP